MHRLILTSALTLSLLSAQDPARRVPPGFVLDEDTGITIRRGFDAEVVYDVPESQGSWVALAFDPKGRLIVSDQDDKGVFRVTLPKGDGDEVRVESLPDFPFEPVAWGRRTVGGALGFVHAFGSLYMSTLKGFWRITDTDGDDTYDEFTLLKRLYNGWEHSAHSIRVTEDGKGLYLISGNHSRVPEGVDSLLPPVWGQDSLLPAMPDPQGHAVGVRAPGGWICRISPDGEDWTMISSGMRNCVDFAIDRTGEMFTYDSDLEFDIGSPWYRPTRVLHVTSASEFGWRAGSAKWPAHYEDGNGTVADIGPGSPTGMEFGHLSGFPAAYQDQLFLCDWTFGTIYTLDLEESGSSYTGRKSVFLSGSPLNIAAMRFGPDGHMYFVVGGRNTDSKLYRIRSLEGPGDGGSLPLRTANQDLRDLRHELEAFHGRGRAPDPERAVEAAWPHLAHHDRAIRYAARIAVESQDVGLWRERVFAEERPRAVIHATIALCRHAEPALSHRILAKLGTLEFADLDRTDRLALLRAASLCLIRLEAPTAAEREALVAMFDPFYPAGDDVLDAELCRMLSFLDAPTVVAKTIRLMERTEAQALAYDEEMLQRHEYGRAILEAMANTPNTRNIHYAYCLRRVRSGWTLQSRKTYFSWLNEMLETSGGKSFAGYIRAIRQDAIDHLAPEDAAAVSWLVGDEAAGGIDLLELPFAKGPARAWTVDSAMELFEDGLRGRNYENGRTMFAAGRCVACHRFRGSGGYSGPDLGSVGKRYSVRDILVSICEPSDSISEQYRASDVVLKDGKTLWGRIIYDKDDELALASNPFDFGQLTRIPRTNVARIEPSNRSMMPEGTIVPMNEDELADLIAYLVSGGDREHAVFTSR